MASAIYAIVNTVTRDMYVGSAVAVNRRWATHRRDLARQSHYNFRLQRAYDKYGKDAFNWEIIQFVDEKSKLIAQEQFWMNFFAPAYNGRPIANSPLGTKHSLETRAKMSAAHKGRVFSAEHKANLAASAQGKIISDEQKTRLSKHNTGKTHSAATKAKLSAILVGNTRAAGTQFSDEERARRSKMMTGNTLRFGKQYTPEERAVISARMKNIWAKRKQEKEA
jgi:group I intron endonuclease